MGQAKHLPERRCAGCRELKDKKDLVRVIRTQEGDVLVDLTGRKNGRGAYLCRKQECFEKAVRTKSLERALKAAVPQEVLSDLEKEIRAVEK